MSGSMDDSLEDTPIVRLGVGYQKRLQVDEHVVSIEDFPVLIRVWLKATADTSPETDQDSLVRWVVSSPVAGKTLKQIAEMFVSTAFIGRVNAVEVKKAHRPSCGYLIYPEWP